jgi:hypothetical protein
MCVYFVLDMAQSIMWETKRHEETVAFNQKRIQTLQDELSQICVDKGTADAKLMELDQLVGQLLAVNESLVAQLSGKPLKYDSALRTTSTSKKLKKTKKTSAAPRAASASTAASEAGRVDKFRKHSSLIPVQSDDLEALKNMHKMYANIARTIKRSTSPGVTKSSGSRSGSAGRRASRSAESSSGGLSSSAGSKGKLVTRLSRKKAQLIDQFNEQAHQNMMSAAHYHEDPRNSVAYGNGVPTGSAAGGPGYTGGSVEVRLPRPNVSFDYQPQGDQPLMNTSIEMDNFYKRHAGDHANNRPVDSSFTRSELSPGRGGGAGGTSMHSNADMQSVIASLEEEFDSLNQQYRKLLSNVQAGTGSSAGAGGEFARPAPASTAESVQAQAEEIVSVIQKLHKKGEQLRTLKSSSP